VLELATSRAMLATARPSCIKMACMRFSVVVAGYTARVLASQAEAIVDR